jgi:hypothetical protein
MNASLDRLYKLLPAVYRLRDAEMGFHLQALLQVIAAQVDVVEADIAQLYQNWFIETCQDWVVPYISDLLGYQPVHEAGEPGDIMTPHGQQRNKILIPRRDVANTIRYRRRKGTLALLEQLAADVAGWPARAVEFQQQLSWTQNLRYQPPALRPTVSLRQAAGLELLNTAFDAANHTIDLRRVNSHRDVGRYGIPNVGLFVWRLPVYSVTQTPASCQEEVGSHCYTFSVLGNDQPLYNLPQPAAEPTQIAEPLSLPVPISRRALQLHKTDYYGIDQSLQIWIGVTQPAHSNAELPAVIKQPVVADQIIVADLSNWQYFPNPGEVAVDPELGRITFPPGHLPKKGVWVSYHYGFSADIGGGEYDRPIRQPNDPKIYPVSKTSELSSINAALNRWRAERPAHAVIEMGDSEVYVEQINIQLAAHQSLQIRAANHQRPVIRLLDWYTDLPDGLAITGELGSRFSVDGLLISGRGLQIEGNLFQVSIRHSTLVPGWGLHCDCEPRRPNEPSLELTNTTAQLVIEHSILGSIEVYENEVRQSPLLIEISDSILDATSPEREALTAPGCRVADAALILRRTTVFGQIHTHAITLAANCLLNGRVRVARRQQGCVRFCYVTPQSRTPRRYHCQPDLVEQSVAEQVEQGKLPAADQERLTAFERDRVRPQFTSTRYGTPAYAQLALTCANEIKRGADDESEMGAFHDLYQPQREANLRARLTEYTPAGTEAGILFVD